MSAYGNSSDPDYASLKKKPPVVTYNIMLPGAGTAWEDRGASGLFAGFFKTAIGSLFKVKRVVDQIRRPETSGDATGFVIGCSVLWGAGVAIFKVAWYYHEIGNTTLRVDGAQYFEETILQVIAATAFVFLAYRIVCSIFHALLSDDNQRQIPKVMVMNVFAYAMGPSILALIPIIGWVLAAGWIFVNAIVATKSRLYLKFRESLTNVVIAAVVCLVLLLALYFGGSLLWHLSYDPSIMPVTPLTPQSMMIG